MRTILATCAWLGCPVVAILALTLAGPGSDWGTINVPGAWQNAPGGKLAKYDGFAWYRCSVKVPGSWKGDDLSLAVQSIRNSYEVYFNGIKLGGSGTFPPDYRDGSSGEPYSYSVPAKHVRPGEANLIAVRVYNAKAPGGFTGPAPFLANDAQAIALQGAWQFRTGDDLAWAKRGDGALPGATFARVEETAAVSKRLSGGKLGRGPLSPAESLKRFTVAPDLEWEQVLAEPVVRQPVFVNFDERGRLWVVQYLQYPHPAGLKMLSRDRYWRAVYDKVPPPPPNHFRGKDRITIHEDTDGDGTFDRHTTFLDGLNIVTAVERGRGGVWVLNPPYLLFYRTRDGSDEPMGDPEVHLEGFGLEDTHSVVNSLCWGPDGWLYAAQGSTVTGNVRGPGKEKEAVHSMGQLIWRYHPETRRYEIFAEGGGNAFGVEIDSKGRVFSGHNGGNTRGFHYVQGGYYQKGFSKHGPLTNPYAFGYFAPMRHPDVPRFSHTFTVYEGGALPGPYRSKLLAVAPLQSRLVLSDLFADRSSLQTRDVANLVTSSDPWFRPVDVKVGPDGAVYVADWYDGQVNHYRNHEGQIDPNTGRIYRLKAKGAPPRKAPDLARLSSVELVKLLGDDNRWVRRTALRLLGDRKDQALLPSLRKMVKEHTGQLALEALWALNLCGGLDDPTALEALAHTEPYVRLWAVRLLGDRKQVSAGIATRLAELARSEPLVEVRGQLASSARRLSAESGLPVVRGLFARSEDASDIHLPPLLWWAIESKAESDRAAVLKLFSERDTWRLPMVERHILERLMRRYAQASGRQNLLTCAKLLESAPEARHVAKLLSGFEQAYAGRPLTGLPEELVRVMAARGGGSLSLRLRRGDAQAIDEALKVVADAKASGKERLRLLQVFGEVKQPRAVPALLGVVKGAGDPALRRAALTALQPHDDSKVGAAVVALYAALPAEVRATAEALLVSRKTWAQQLLGAVDAGKIEKRLVSLDSVRRLTVHRDETIDRLVARHWGKVQGATTAQMRQRIEHYERALQGGTGSPYRGKQLYEASCARCHALFGRGGQVGPDLTAYKRDDLPNMLLSIVNPSAEIREGFETHLAITQDGRALTGFLVERDNRVVVLRGADGQDVVLERENLDDLRPVAQSLMPEGLLDGLSDAQVRDLFAYLRSTQPLND
ncbi:MAG: c-type cytochrome [Gemmataceae bacterium]|nr:c-type cytochrome [Gemmataceae bacterium]